MKRTLTLRSETLAMLTTEELSAVAGGAVTNTVKCLTEDSVLICPVATYWETCTE